MTDRRPEPPYGIVGLGLVGGSLARAIKKLDAGARIVGVDPNEETRRRATEIGAVDVALAAPGVALGQCRLVVLCTPLGALESVLTGLAEHLDPTALITDVIGVKQPVADTVTRLLPGHTFVGGHPMAGGERGGFNRARADLFDNCQVALCPTAETTDAAASLSALWRDLGAKPLVIDAETHDRIVAGTSHLPYLAAIALVRLLDEQDAPERFAGRGLADAIRHAGFDPEIMAAVAASNPAVPEMARRLAEHLTTLADLAQSNPKALAKTAGKAQQICARLLDRSD